MLSDLVKQYWKILYDTRNIFIKSSKRGLNSKSSHEKNCSIYKRYIEFLQFSIKEYVPITWYEIIFEKKRIEDCQMS